METVASAAPPIEPWSPPRSTARTPQHAVQFYEDDQYFVTIVASFLAEGLRAGDNIVVIAGSGHTRLLLDALTSDQLPVDEALASGQLALFDARETLARFMVLGMPDARLFQTEIGAVLERTRARKPGARLRAFGEMVDFLWRDGNGQAALSLERLWNDLARVYEFELLCAYGMRNFGSSAHCDLFEEICASHSHVAPTERYWRATDSELLLTEIAVLQQRARALEAEVERRTQLEAELRETLARCRSAEEQLRARQDELLDFFENAGEGLHRLAPDGTITAANRAELDMLGYARDDYVGRNIVDFHDDPAAARDLLARLARGETLKDHEATLRCRDGSRKHVLITATSSMRDGRVVHVRCFSRDITERRRLAEELRRQNEDLSRTVRFSETFVGILGHDLRNPLSGITTAASLLARRADSERVAKPATRILNSGRRMARMIDQLLDFTRIRLGKGLPLDRQVINLEEVCRVSIDELDMTADFARVGLSAVGNVTGWWDADRLSQLISNLLGNAIVHGTPDLGAGLGAPEVEVEVDGRADENVTIEIKNRGVIPPELRSMMFEPLKHQPTDRKQERSSGLGLGLYISQQIVVAHGGTIEVASSEGDGTRILVCLPRSVGRTEAAFQSSLRDNF